MHHIKLFALLAPIVLAVDLVWIGLIMKGFYTQELGEIARRAGGGLAPRWGAAIAVYLLIPAGLVLFVRPLVGNDARLATALMWGGLFGLIMYGVYDFTNLATLDKWTLRMTVVDISWGAALCGSMSVVMALLNRWLRN